MHCNHNYVFSLNKGKEQRPNTLSCDATDITQVPLTINVFVSSHGNIFINRSLNFGTFVHVNVAIMNTFTLCWLNIKVVFFLLKWNNREYDWLMGKPAWNTLQG